MRKRDKKFNEKYITEAQCRQCQVIFDKIKKKTGMCYNCNKVFKAAKSIAKTHDGIIEFVDATKEIQLVCVNQHKWAVPFKVKFVKYWCTRCPNRSERDRRKAYFRE